MSSYCSIEEAWGDNFCKPTKPKKKKVVLDGDDYYRATLPNKRRSKTRPKKYKYTDIYDTHNYYMDNSNINTNTEPYYEKNNFSRGVRRLPNHNGPETRSLLQDIHSQENDKGDYIGYSTKDLLNYESINGSNKAQDDIYECPDDDKLYNTDNESEDEDKELREDFDNLDTLSNKLNDKLQNDKLQNDIPSSNNPGNYNNSGNVNEGGTIMNPTNNLYDLILYIFTGVFYLVLCDFIYKLGKKTY